MNAINFIFESGKTVQFMNIEKPTDDPKDDNPVVIDPPKK
ncbi:hypothetical protein Palpr_1750 [Paludibacter propionicigenes WB4]|uniref:Uncharacterized protein n=1 Tax=Paludibacter propionicigenes (strain DSM 17365 / JCM 13257 / WB4) TaxID=694427 RepID=E4T595_PALPW|nr:hypothetical protein Palpr_1750 [Paludibacter propionicigenes WB4]